ncbi:CYTH and CHAD domain-containing protein [Psychrobacter sp. APC 3426]|uniref:CYTH and CHAD domain-containing protein n=1 Tax=Psychrobacter sp. APC 3426 TaxID=3035177 RepID=UPI0025B3B42F|nr:CYTH and CHAD domain-containing protein [Psychrobacter sp. APC 3426]MDN3397287.1 CYTH and CHAD domain-containing protein [Psychrobacter sp. APC 3426]
MQEIELKFLVPESRLKGLMRQAKVKSSEVTQLAAHYYDTPDQQLAQAGIGLRIRKEGDTWVQTIKAGGDGIAARLEHNAVLDNEQVQAMLDNNELMPDLTIYKNTSIAPALADFKLKKLTKKLTRLYVTDVERTTRLLIDDSDEAANNQIEMAYDDGDIIHGNDDDKRDAIQEIEFELISGDIDFLFATAKTWCKRYKLCLSTVTKAERGGLLITEQTHSPAVNADLKQMTINKKTSLPAFIRAAVHNCLLQILPNSSAIVAGSKEDEHILQLYIGIARLTAALQMFADYSDEVNPEWLLILNQTARLLDGYHELGYVASDIEPNLQRHGAPIVDWTADIDALKITPKDAVSANDFQLTLLELIAFTMSDPSIEPRADKRVIDKLANTFSNQYAKFANAAHNLQSNPHSGSDITKSANDNIKGIDSADDDSQTIGSDSVNLASLDVEDPIHEQALHELHHQLEILHYGSEFAAPLLDKKKSKKKTKRMLKHLLKAKKAVAQYRNHAQYQQRYQLKSLTNTNACYGAGWFAAMLIRDQKHAEKRLAKVKDISVLF